MYEQTRRRRKYIQQQYEGYQVRIQARMLAYIKILVSPPLDLILGPVACG